MWPREAKTSDLLNEHLLIGCAIHDCAGLSLELIFMQRTNQYSLHGSMPTQLQV